MAAHPEAPAARLRVQLVPPGEGGVRDHALALQAAWREQGVPSLLSSLDRGGAQQQPLHSQLLERVGSAPVSLLLHYSGYGYGSRGLSGWLGDELARARQALGPQLRVVGLFHELFAIGPPWRSAFWLLPWQQRAARGVLRSCDAWVTNTQHHARWLQRAAAAGQRGLVRPVFSNVGETHAPPSARSREPRLVLFGSAATRARAAQHLVWAEGSLRALGITGLTEIGPGASALPTLAGLPAVHLGSVPAAELSAKLLAHRFALIDYPVRYLGKSGVFAAYAAHGCVVLNTAPRLPGADGLEPGLHEHHLATGTGPLAGASAQDRSAAALHRWYASHHLGLQAAQLGQLLDGR